MKSALGLLAIVVAAACSAGPPAPVALDVNQVSCAHCRMIVSDHRFASQVVSRRDEPRFFDDLGCLSNFIESAGGLPDGSVVYVADHRTNRWVSLDTAVLTHVDSITAPMGSHVVAHESIASRDADPAAASGKPVDHREIVRGRR
jgi:copper chaperone NosL